MRRPPEVLTRLSDTTHGILLRRFPEAVVVAAVGIIMLAVTDRGLDARHYLFVVASVVAVILMGRWPLLGAVLTLPVLPFATFLMGNSGAISMVVAAVVIEIVVSNGLLTMGAALVIAHVLLSSIDLTNQTFSVDPLGMLLLAVFFVISYTVGYNRYIQRRRRLELQYSLAESQRRQRLTVARDLHDSVATSLTSVVMRSQALELTLTGDDEEAVRVRRELEGISENSRTALEQLRAMLRVLNTELPDEPSVSSNPVPVRDSLRNAVNELRAHDLRVESRVELPRAAAARVDENAVARILVEMTSNAVKHSPSRSTVVLDCHVESSGGSPRFVLSMSNPVADASPTESPENQLFSTHIGLSSMRSRASDAGGSMTMGREEGTPALWRTALTLPIVG
jgi:signal transduction histidine kinase